MKPTPRSAATTWLGKATDWQLDQLASTHEALHGYWDEPSAVPAERLVYAVMPTPNCTKEGCTSFWAALGIPDYGEIDGDFVLEFVDSVLTGADQRAVAVV